MKQLGPDWVGVSISQATLREEDLIPAFEDVITGSGTDLPDRPDAVQKMLDGEDGIQNVMTDKDWEGVSRYLNEDLFDLLNEIAPEGCYFGAHEGDGADFGFWQVEETTAGRVPSN